MYGLVVEKCFSVEKNGKKAGGKTGSEHLLAEPLGRKPTYRNPEISCFIGLTTKASWPCVNHKTSASPSNEGNSRKANVTGATPRPQNCKNTTTPWARKPDNPRTLHNSKLGALQQFKPARTTKRLSPLNTHEKMHAPLGANLTAQRATRDPT